MATPGARFIMIAFEVIQDPSTTLDMNGAIVSSGSGTTVNREIMRFFGNGAWVVEADGGATTDP